MGKYFGLKVLSLRGRIARGRQSNYLFQMIRLDRAEHPESVTSLEVITQDTRPGNSHYSLISRKKRGHPVS